VHTVRDFVSRNASLQEVIFCCYSEQDLALYQMLLG